MAGHRSSSDGYQCCFCGKAIEKDNVDPILLTVVVEDDGEQDLHSHRACLKEALHPSVPLFVWSDE
jgi:hypothetical protein